MEGAEKAAGGDQFVLEDLLDFSNEEEEEEGGGWGFNAGLAGNSTDDSSTVTAVESCGNSFSSCGSHVTGDLPPRSFAENVLCGLQDDQAELEWLSNFVEESFSSEDLHIRNFLSASNSTASTLSAAATAGVSATNHISRFQPEAAVPAKARSKRSRPAPCSWTSQLVLFSPSMTADSSPESEFISAPVDALQNEYSKKLPKKTHVTATMTIPTAGRRCLHCQAEKTPQWRAGPMGPKTLCNACGVRYKSGRLVPEYRPAASPTFVPSKHSNSHRKVIELRRQKDLQREGGDIAESYASGSASEPGGDGFFYHHGHAGAELKESYNCARGKELAEGQQ